MSKLPHPKFEEFGKAKAATKKIRGALRDLPTDPARQLREKLGKCRKGARCKLEACPKCRRRLRLHLVQDCLPILAEGQWCRASIVCEGFEYPYETTATLPWRRIAERVRTRLNRLGLADLKVIGGIDVSLNCYPDAKKTWLVHFYLLINQPKSEALRKKLQEKFKRGPARKHIELKNIANTPEKCITYMYKSEFGIAIKYGEYMRNKPKKGSKPQIKVGKKLAKLALLFGSEPVGCRLVLVGVRREHGRIKPIGCRRQNGAESTEGGDRG